MHAQTEYSNLRVDLPLTSDRTASRLYQEHSSILDKKLILDEFALNHTIHFDLARMYYVLEQIQTFNVNHALHRFFGEQFSLLPSFISEKAEHRLNHIGFEIYTPLDVWVTLEKTWENQLSQMKGLTFTIEKMTRFPSSQALQTRVGAQVEIMCVWFRMANRLMVVELFDIAHPVNGYLKEAGFNSDINFDSGSTKLKTGSWIAKSFKNDPIWHYAIHLENHEMVEKTHESFVKLAANQPQYRLAYFKPVYNRFDGSFHTKIIHDELGMELEFATA